MAMVAKKAIVWLSGEEGLRIEVGIDSVVPDVVPLDIQKEWEKEDWIYEDRTKAHIAAPEGPPRMTMPLRQIQQVEAAKKASAAPVLGKSIPPRPMAGS